MQEIRKVMKAFSRFCLFFLMKDFIIIIMSYHAESMMLWNGGGKDDSQKIQWFYWNYRAGLD